MCGTVLVSLGTSDGDKRSMPLLNTLLGLSVEKTRKIGCAKLGINICNCEPSLGELTRRLRADKVRTTACCVRREIARKKSCAHRSCSCYDRFSSLPSFLTLFPPFSLTLPSIRLYVSLSLYHCFFSAPSNFLLGQWFRGCKSCYGRAYNQPWKDYVRYEDNCLLRWPTGILESFTGVPFPFSPFLHYLLSRTTLGSTINLLRGARSTAKIV